MSNFKCILFCLSVIIKMLLYPVYLLLDLIHYILTGKRMNIDLF